MTDQPLTEVPPHDGPSVDGRGPRGEVATGWWRLALLGSAVVALGLLAGRGWLLIIGALFVMIFLHELGHFATAKWTGMKVTEFFIGIGPKLWSFRRGETEYGVKLIPLVAYVRIIGMNNLDECPPEDEPRTYRQQSFPRRMLVISAGSMMHFAQALVLFFVVFSILGVPGDTDLAQKFGGQRPDWGISALRDEGAAAAAGIEVGDHLVSIDGHRLGDMDDVGPLVRDRAGDELVVEVERDGQLLAIPVDVGTRPGTANEGFLGVEMRYEHLDQLPSVTTGPVDGIVRSGQQTADWMWQTTKSLGMFFTGGLGDFAERVVDGSRGDSPAVGTSSSGQSEPEADGDRAVSIYGVARIGADMSEDGMAEFLLLLAVVNISIGVLNLFPLLPLDGGHAAIAIYERIRSIGGRRHMADVSRLLPLTYAFVFLLGLIMVSSLYLDIVDPIGV